MGPAYELMMLGSLRESNITERISQTFWMKGSGLLEENAIITQKIIQQNLTIAYKLWKNIELMAIYQYQSIEVIYFFNLQHIDQQVIMGNCLTPKSDRLCRINKQQSILLQMLYKDLASRSHTELLTKENFDIFFHLHGLWSEQIFSKFDCQNRGAIDFEQFKIKIQQMVKSTRRDKSRILFSFYNINHTNRITYQDLIKMLYSYPKEELMHIVRDDKFIKDMDIQDRFYHFGANKQFDQEKQVVELESVQEQLDQISEFNLSEADENVNAKRHHSLENCKRKSNKSREQAPSNLKLPSKQSKYLANQRLKKTKSMSLAQLDLLKKQKCRITSNLTLVVKKYANFLFKELGLDKDTDTLCENDFIKILQKHDGFITLFFTGFHNYIWQIDATTNVSLRTKQVTWIESPCEQAKKDGRCRRYIRFIKMTLFVFQDCDSAQPIAIKNLQGLEVAEFNQVASGSKYYHGFILRHRDGFYQQTAYFLSSQSLQKQWLDHLKHFKMNSIYDLYKLHEKIGAGSYSYVYRGTEKCTKEEVAIKVIEKTRLRQSQRKTIKHQCEILALCHHPCVVKFKANLETKTHIYIITEILSQGGLEEYVRSKQFLQEYQASLIVKQLIETLLYLNSLGLIHRDLKPNNVMIRLKENQKFIERVKIIDFGFAIYKDAIKNLPQKERYAGTLGYLAPEVIKAEQYDELVDNFSLGVMIYYMLSGIMPFNGVSDDDTIKFTLRGHIQFKNAHWMNISPQAKQMITLLLAPKQQRMTLQQAIKHPWVAEPQELKSYNSKK